MEDFQPFNLDINKILKVSRDELLEDDLSSHEIEMKWNASISVVKGNYNIYIHVISTLS